MPGVQGGGSRGVYPFIYLSFLKKLFQLLALFLYVIGCLLELLSLALHGPVLFYRNLKGAFTDLGVYLSFLGRYDNRKLLSRRKIFLRGNRATRRNQNSQYCDSHQSCPEMSHRVRLKTEE